MTERGCCSFISRSRTFKHMQRPSLHNLKSEIVSIRSWTIRNFHYLLRFSHNFYIVLSVQLQRTQPKSIKTKSPIYNFSYQKISITSQPLSPTSVVPKVQLAIHYPALNGKIHALEGRKGFPFPTEVFALKTRNLDVSAKHEPSRHLMGKYFSQCLSKISFGII